MNARLGGAVVVAIACGSTRADAQATVEQLRAELYQLRTELEAVLDSPSPTQVDHEGGFVWTSEDEAYQLRIGGLLQSRWSLTRGDAVENADDAGGFALRRARVALDGSVPGDLGFRIMAELVEPALVEGWLEYHQDAWSIRAGRDRVPFLRSGVMPESAYAFAERATVSTAYGYDRDLGVALRYHPSRSPIQAAIMVANGDRTEELRLADDDAPMVAVRIAATPIGPRPDPGAGDFEGRLSVTLGVNAAVSAAMAPTTIGELELMSDRVTTGTTGLDLTVRCAHFELVAEGMLRIEGWGDLLVDNPALAAAIDQDPAAEASRRYLAGAVDASYVVDRTILIGARVAGGQLPFLANVGESMIPPGRSLLELDGTIGFYRQRERILGVTYRYLDHGERYAGGGDGPVEHLVIAEAQLAL